MTSKNITLKKVEHFLHGHFMHGVVVFFVALNAVILGLKTNVDLYMSFGKMLDFIDISTVIVLATVVYARWLQLGSGFLKSNWHVFDALIVTLSIVGYFFNFEFLQPFRILMLFRMTELFPSMRVLVDALFRALKGLMSSVVVLCMTFYIFGYIGYFYFGPHLHQDFGSLTKAMSTLMSIMTFDDFRTIAGEMEKVGSFAWLYILLFLLSSTFSFFNLLVGVVVQAMSDATHHARKKLSD